MENKNNLTKRHKIDVETKFWNKDKWWNWHNTADVGGKFNQFYVPYNKYTSGGTDSDPAPNRPFQPGIAGLVDAVENAGQKGKKIRVFASRWSLNNIAYSDEFMIMTSNLNKVLVGAVEQSDLAEQYTGDKKNVVFVQGGTLVKELNKALESNGLALPTSGASDGQLFAGAVSTGTHGAAQNFGAMQDYVKGIHLIILDQENNNKAKSVYLQRASDPVINQSYCDRLLEGAELIADDDLFNAAVVGFGSFGVIHGLLIEVEPCYKLNKFVKQYQYSNDPTESPNWYNDIRALMENPNKAMPAFLGIPMQTEAAPYHFEVVFNPYYASANDVKNPVFVRLMYKEPMNLAANSPENLEPQEVHNSDIMSVLAPLNKGEHDPDQAEDESSRQLILSLRQLLDTSAPEGLAKAQEDAHPLVADILQVAMRRSIPETKKGGTYVMQPGTPGQQFQDPFKEFKPKPYKGASLEIGISRDNVIDALDLIVKTVNTHNHAFLAPVAFRFVKGQAANKGGMLAFTKFANTVTIEMPGLDYPAATRGHQAVFNAFKESGIPHTYHWGQNLPINKEWVIESYGADVVNKWKEQRSKLLGQYGCSIFSNDLVDSIGLGDYVEGGTGTGDGNVIA